VPEAPPAVSGCDGAPETYSFKGDSIVLTQRFVGERLVQTFRSADGARENTYELAPDGSTLRVTVEILSSRLNHPIVYRVTYRR
jgi:hypothetical protein